MTTTKAGAVKAIALSWCVVGMVAGCSGATTGSQEAAVESTLPVPEASEPSSAEAEICGALLPQQEGFNYFPPLIQSEREGAPESLEAMITKVEEVDASAVPDLESDLETLAATMVLGRGEAEDFDYDSFVAAKVEVDKWVNSNCF